MRRELAPAAFSLLKFTVGAIHESPANAFPPGGRHFTVAPQASPVQGEVSFSKENDGGVVRADLQFALLSLRGLKGRGNPLVQHFDLRRSLIDVAGRFPRA